MIPQIIYVAAHPLYHTTFDLPSSLFGGGIARKHLLQRLLSPLLSLVAVAWLKVIGLIDQTCIFCVTYRVISVVKILFASGGG